MMSQTAASETVPQFGTIAEVTRWPELRARVAGSCHLIEHHGGLERQRVTHGLLEDAPRDRRRCDLDLAHRSLLL